MSVLIFLFLPPPGTLGKSIRTETKWLSPVEFVKAALDHPDAIWKKDIVMEGQPLSALIEVTMVTCIITLIQSISFSFAIKGNMFFQLDTYTVMWNRSSRNHCFITGYSKVMKWFWNGVKSINNTTSTLLHFHWYGFLALVPPFPSTWDFSDSEN